jgi:hypothetical protein
VDFANAGERPSNASGGPHATVTIPAGCFGLGEGVGAIVTAVNKKMDMDYVAFSPIWLAVSMEHVIAPSNESVFDWIRRSLRRLGQFEKLFFCNSNQVLVAE